MGVSRKTAPILQVGWVCKGGAVSQGGVQTQRWGQNAKKQGGVKTQMAIRTNRLYSYENMKKIAESRGYMSARAIAFRLAPLLGMTEQSVKAKLKSGTFSMDETFITGAFFQMSPEEYYEVFMGGLFRKNNAGRYVCCLDDVNNNLEPVNEKPRKKKQEKKEKKKHWKEILKELENE